MEKIVTAIELQKKNKRRVNIFINEEYAFGLSEAAAKGLRTGQVLSGQDMEQLQEKETKTKTKDLAYNYLSYRPRSTKELQNHLLRKGLPESTVDSVITELTEDNQLNDLEFARYWVGQREDFRPKGLYALRHELLQKGVGDPIIETVLSSIDEHRSARKAGQRKADQLQGSEYDLFIRKLSQHLERRGFSYQIIADVTREFWRESTLNTEEKSFSKGE